MAITSESVPDLMRAWLPSARPGLAGAGGHRKVEEPEVCLAAHVEHAPRGGDCPLELDLHAASDGGRRPPDPRWRSPRDSILRRPDVGPNGASCLCIFHDAR